MPLFTDDDHEQHESLNKRSQRTVINDYSKVIVYQVIIQKSITLLFEQLRFEI